MIYTMKKLFFKSPWDDVDNENNVFTKKKSFQRPSNPFDNFNFDFNKNTIYIGLIAIFSLWLLSGIYKVREGEEAVIMRFGNFVRKGTPGLNYRLPAPFEKTIIESVNKSRRIEIGYRSSSNQNSNYYIAAESLMLTGDQNIIDLNADIMWHIKDIESYIFNVSGPEETVKLATESAIREVIGATPISSVLSNQKQEIADKIEKLTQEILDYYNSGIIIEKVQLLKAEPPAEVIDAYRDVQTSKADKERAINQAQAYSNDILPKARGEAEKMLQEAEGYKQSVIAKSEGDTSRFNAIFAQYNNSKQTTKDRLYLETVEQILAGSKKVIMGAEALPHMAIDQK